VKNRIPHAKWKLRLALLVILPGVALLDTGCSSSSTGSTQGVLETSGQITYSRLRDMSGNVTPVLSEGSGFDAAEVDSPNIAVDKSRVAGDKFMMFYEAQDASGKNTIGLVTSDEEDFAILTVPRTEVIGLGATGSGYETGATDPTVILDKRPAEAARRYKMWFEGRNGSASTIVFATSADGLAWTGFTPCTGLTPSFGAIRVADPSVTLNGSLYQMWFEAINSATGGKDGAGEIGYAESSDGIAWIIKDAAGNTAAAAGSVFAPGAAGQFDAYSVNAPSVLIDTSVGVGAPGRYKLWYEAANSGADVQNTIGYATSSDGLTWSRSALPVLVPSSDLKVPLPFDSGDLEHPTAVIVYTIPQAIEGHFLLWYTGDGEGGASPNRIGLVKGSIP
jgi:hypothetical protein